ncbi:hypothetical protein C1882_01850 [Pseudomonas sp. FW305-E2]|jgi:hypothetical protein|nr:hypothetical protein C1882_01850 [Pseudomonas sp. FW305-E2]PTV62588.1 hypothetical protein DBL05_03725 [Pseudomonas putida]PYB93689.1 hypothetical protein DMX01_03975 [Pseudomonas fulva]PYC16515.1 hypothetical protein DMX00_05570 [Pseudomonas fulva]
MVIRSENPCYELICISGIRIYIPETHREIGNALGMMRARAKPQEMPFGHVIGDLESIGLSAVGERGPYLEPWIAPIGTFGGYRNRYPFWANQEKRLTLSIQ